MSRQKAKSSLEKGKSKTMLSGMLRNKALSYGLVGAAVVGGWFGYSKIPVWSGMEPEYSLNIVYLNHNSRDDAYRLVSEMDNAAKQGKPFDIMLAENGTQLASNYDDTVRGVDKKMAKLRDDYSSLLDKGISKSDSEQATLRYLNMGPNDADRFMAVVFNGAAVRGIKIMPLELMSDDEATYYAKRSSDLKAMDQKMYQLIEMDAPLKEIVACEMETNKVSLDLLVKRNANLAKELKWELSEAKKLFPDLKWDRVLGRPIRIIAWMGYSHQGNLTSSQDNALKEVSITEEKYVYSGNPVSYRVLDEMHGGEMSKKEAYISAIGKRYNDDLQQVNRTNPVIYNNGIDNLFKLTEAQLEDIADRSSKISDPKQRECFILNTALGLELFKP